MNQTNYTVQGVTLDREDALALYHMGKMGGAVNVGPPGLNMPMYQALGGEWMIGLKSITNLVHHDDGRLLQGCSDGWLYVTEPGQRIADRLRELHGWELEYDHSQDAWWESME